MAQRSMRRDRENQLEQVPRARRSDWDLIRELHTGPRHVSRIKAGHMSAPDYARTNRRFFLRPRGRPHMCLIER